jgi:signal transduction histidine kinase
MTEYEREPDETVAGLHLVLHARGLGYRTREKPDATKRVESLSPQGVSAVRSPHPGRYTDGSVVWLEERGHAQRDMTGRRTLAGVTSDVTSRMRMEASLRESQACLEEADRRKDEFLATLAHELRNPLARLRTGVRLLRMAQADGAARDHVTAMMERQIAHVVRLVDDLLEVSHITRGKIHLREDLVDISTVLRNALETAGPLIEASKHTLTVKMPDEPLFVYGDSVRLAQILGNLLDNAAKYTEPGGRIDVTVTRRGEAVRLAVHDTEYGIPAEMLPRVFDLFTQVDRTLGRAHFRSSAVIIKWAA